MRVDCVLWACSPPGCTQQHCPPPLPPRPPDLAQADLAQSLTNNKGPVGSNIAPMFGGGIVFTHMSRVMAAGQDWVELERPLHADVELAFQPQLVRCVCGASLCVQCCTVQTCWLSAMLSCHGCNNISATVQDGAGQGGGSWHRGHNNLIPPYAIPGAPRGCAEGSAVMCAVFSAGRSMQHP